MDRIEIGALSFVRSAAAADNRLEAANMFKERSLDLGGLAFDTLEADLFTRTLHTELSTVPGGTPVLVYRGERQAARFFTKTIRRTGANSYHVSALSAMSVLTAMPHPGGIYTGQTAEEVIRDICGSVPVAVKSNFAEIALYGWLPYVKPPETSARDNLSQVLFAIGASLGTDLEGVLRVEPLWDGVASVIAPERLYDRGSVEYDSRKITAVTVMEHQYVQGGESKELFSGTTQEGDVITFDAPMYGLSASGFTIRKSGANYAVVSSGSGTLTGRAYIHTTRQVTEPVTAAEEENVKTIKDATLVSLVNSQAVAKRLAAYCRCTETIKNPVVAGKERPGDVVSIYHPYDKKMVQACIASADTTLSSTLRSDLKALVGFKPPKVEAIEYYDERVLISENQVYELPEGVTTVRAVIIGGGSGGQGGIAGSSGGAGGDAQISAGANGTNIGTKAAAGKGGAGGAPGPGGKVFAVDLDVSESKVLDIKIGTPGTGGAAGGGQGTSGEPTTITMPGVVYSSEDGSSSGSGYVDTTTGISYAIPGSTGLTGGNGGAAGDAGQPGGSGGNVGAQTGGSGNAEAYIISDGTYKAPWQFDRYDVFGPTDISRSTEFNAIYTGYASYSISNTNGSIIVSSRTDKIGMVGGQIVTGIVYYNPRNGSESDLTSDGRTTSTISYHRVENIQGVTNQFRCVNGNIAVNRYYRSAGTASYLTAYLPAGGGGAAFGASGGNAAARCAGGAGGSAAAPSAPTVFGSGGNGGHGGGGGGAGGSGYVEIRNNNAGIGISRRVSGAAGGSAGAGSKGSDGAPGCVILYYGRPKIIKSGPVVTADKKFFLDPRGRRLIV